jgi:hypothetical protein
LLLDNRTGEDLHIKKITTHCGCTELLAPPGKILNETTGLLKIAILPVEPAHPFSQYGLTIDFGNPHGEVRLEMYATVDPAIAYLAGKEIVLEVPPLIDVDQPSKAVNFALEFLKSPSMDLSRMRVVPSAEVSFVKWRIESTKETERRARVVGVCDSHEIEPGVTQGTVTIVLLADNMKDVLNSFPVTVKMIHPPPFSILPKSVQLYPDGTSGDSFVQGLIRFKVKMSEEELASVHFGVNGIEGAKLETKYVAKGLYSYRIVIPASIAAKLSSKTDCRITASMQQKIKTHLIPKDFDLDITIVRSNLQ